MNTSIRYIALAILVAFSGAQVCAMENSNPANLSDANNNNAAPVITSEEASKIAKELKKDKSSAVKKWIAQAIEAAQQSAALAQAIPVIKTPIAVVMNHPYITGSVLGISVIGGTIVLVYKTEKGQQAYAKVCSVAKYAKETAVAHPLLTASAIATTAAGIAYQFGFMPQTAGLFAKASAYCPSWIPSIETMKSKLPDWKKALSVSALAAAVTGFFYAPKAIANNNNNNNDNVKTLPAADAKTIRAQLAAKISNGLTKIIQTKQGTAVSLSQMKTLQPLLQQFDNCIAKNEISQAKSIQNKIDMMFRTYIVSGTMTHLA